MGNDQEIDQSDALLINWQITPESERKNELEIQMTKIIVKNTSDIYTFENKHIDINAIYLLIFTRLKKDNL